MGGCKCSYISCSKTSDGKTHFFHYPVKDPLRCQQWIENSNREEYKTIRISQLKNKVVCEKHFPEPMFMNYKHERLIHSAVPIKEVIEDGMKQNNVIVKIDEQKEEATKKLRNIAPKDINIKSLDTDSNNKDKEMSTLAVNVSPITGLSFFNTHEKKTKNAPYIEILTRLHDKPLPYIAIAPKPTMTTIIQGKNATKETQTFKSDNQNGKDIVNDSTKTIDPPVFIVPTKPVDPKKNKKPIYMQDSSIKSEKIYKTPKILRKYGNILNKPDSNSKQFVDNQTKSIDLDYEVPLCGIGDIVPIESYQSDPDIVVTEKSIINKNTDSVNNMHDNDIIILPMDTDVQNKVSLYNICTENVAQTNTDSNNMIYENLVNESARMLNAMKSIQGKIEHMNTERIKENKRRTIVKRTLKRHKFQPLSKASLYAQIVPFLSPELAKQVHMEMFPSLRRMHRN